MSALARRRPTRTSLAGFILCAALLALPASAVAGPFKADKAGDARAPGLKGAQRKALDLTGIELTRTAGLARVDLTFKGNFAKAMRSRRLKGGGAAIRLTGSMGTVRVASIGLGATARTVGTPSSPGKYASLRTGRKLTFWIADIDGYAIRRIQARTFLPARLARSRASQKSAIEQVFDQYIVDSGLLNLFAGSPENIAVNCRRLEQLVNDLREAASNPNLGSRARAEFQKLLERAERAVEVCKQAGGTPGGGGSGGGGTGGGTGGGGTAGAPECSNGVDQQGEPDTLIDFGPDPGCFEPIDADEKDVTETGPPDCGPPGSITRIWLDLGFPTPYPLVGHRLVNAGNGAVIHQEANSGHAGSVPIDIGCGAGINVTLQDGAGANAPNPGGEVPAPTAPQGETVFRFLVTINNPLGSGNPGSASPVDMRASLNTRLP